MYSGFTKLLWGFVFLFDFRLNGFDVLPDPIGYLLIFLGMTALMDFFIVFKNIRWIAIVLLFTSIPDVFQQQGVAFNTSTGMSYDIGFLLFISLISTILHLILLYTIFISICYMARKYGFNDLADLSRLTWILTLVGSILLYVALALLFLAIPLIILGFVNFILQLVVIVKARDKFMNIQSIDHEQY